MLNFIIISLLSFQVFANEIDDKCPSFAYKKAPAVKADQFLCKLQYAIAYSYETRNPIYTTHFLKKSHIGYNPRVDSFSEDKDVPKEFRVKHSDYTNTICNGDSCDRGHLAPNQDFSACKDCAEESFLMTNMIPQNSKNNRVIWRVLESKVRKYVQKDNDVFVIAGPSYGKNYTTTIKGIRVPTHLFKIIINKETGKSISFMMKNQDIPSTDLHTKVVNLRKIEQGTGIVFDKSLDKDTHANYYDWFDK